MNQTEEIRAKMNAQGKQLTEQQQRHKAFREKLDLWHKKNGHVLASLFGTPEDAVRLWLAARNTLQINPALLETDANTFATCLVMSAQMKLYPGPSQECGLIPMKGQAHWWPMYKGLVKLGTLSRQVRSVDVMEVCEKDEFDVVWGQRPKLHHKIDYRVKRDDRGPVIAVYATYELTNSKRPVFEVMSWEDVQTIKKNSPAVKNNRPSPWTSGNLSEIEMGKKTVLKRGYKTIPISPELAYVIAIDNVIETEGKVRTRQVDVAGTMTEEFLSDPVVVPEADYSQTPEEEAPKQEQQAIEHQERIAVNIPQQQPQERVEVMTGGGIAAGKSQVVRDWANDNNAEVVGPATSPWDQAKANEEAAAIEGELDASFALPALEEQKSAARTEFDRIKERAAKEKEKSERKLNKTADSALVPPTTTDADE